LILADTSVWIEHLRYGNERMREHLNHGQIASHPFIVAELALGSLKERASTLALMDLLPQVRMARIEEVRAMIEGRHLYNLGIGLVDAHLIASVFLNPFTCLWSRDKQLRKVAAILGIDAGLA